MSILDKEQGEESIDHRSATALPSETVPVSDIDVPDHDHVRIGATIGCYKITGLLGRGSQGVVYSTLDLTLEREVALKLLATVAGTRAEQWRRQLRGVRAATVAHPNIAMIFDTGEIDGIGFIAMELVKGRSLRAVMTASAGAFPEKDALRIAREIARGVAAAHAAGIIHRDLKPENVMISHTGAVKVVDFGVATPTEAGGIPGGFESTDVVTQPGRRSGTPGYMSPEQARGLALDARSDVFALGVVLYEMLTRARPFRGATATDVLTSTLRDPAPTLALLNDGVRSALVNIVSRCLEKDASRRYANASELVAALEAITPLPAPTPTPQSRRRWWLGAAGLVLTGAMFPADVIVGSTPTGRSSSSIIALSVSVDNGGWWTLHSYNVLALTSGGDILSLRRTAQNGSPALRAIKPRWTKLDPIPEPTAISTSGMVMLAIDRAGAIWRWTSQAPRPARLDVPAGVRSFALGNTGALLLNEGGAISAIDSWKRAAGGAASEPTTSFAIKPVPGLDRVKAVSGELFDWAAIRENGTVWSWHKEELRTPGRAWAPEQEELLTNVVAISSAVSNSLALDADGAVWAWACGNSGAPGPQGPERVVRVVDLPKITAVSAGEDHWLALDEAGRVWEWGLVEHDDRKALVPPRVVENLPRVQLIASSAHTSFAVANGNLWIWGDSSDEGYWSNRPVPVLFEIPNQVEPWLP